MEEADLAEMPGSDFTSIELPFRFKVVNVVPVASFVTLIGGLALAGAPVQAPRLATLLANARQYGWAGAAISAALVVLLSFITEPLEIASIRLLEGYWAPSGPFRSLINAGVWLQRRKRSRLQFLSGQSDVPRNVAQWSARVLYEHYPREDRLLPTTLGNRLRAFEDRAGIAYNISSTTWWPRLHLALPEPALATVNGYRNQLDVAARLTISFSFSGVTSGALLVRHPLWLLLPAGLIVMAALSYRAALAAVAGYGASVTAAIDVHRLLLLQTMRIEMPRDIEEERGINEELSLLWTGDETANVKYDTASTSRPKQ